MSDPRIAAVGFTGSRAGGLALLAAAQRRPVPIPVFAEMSSTNPVFVMPGALAAGPQALAAGFLGSMTASAGQLCTSPGQLFAVPGLGFDEFRAALAAGLAATPPATMLTAATAAAYDDGIRRWTARPATTALGGGRTTGATVVQTGSAQFLTEPTLRDEVFGTAAVLVSCLEPAELLVVAESLDGQLTATIHTTPEDAPLARALLTVLERKAGRVIVNGWPTGVEVGPATIHGGPFPATSDARTTSVGSMAIERFLRPVCYQNLPDYL